MSKQVFKIGLLFLLILFISSTIAFSQINKNDTIRLGAIVIENDTLPVVFLRDAIITAKGNASLVKKRRQERENQEAFDRLRYNVYKVYPYAVAAGFVLHDVDSMLTIIKSKDARSLYKERKEEELNAKFKGELENLSISQGQVLVKLIARQTGKPCYQIVKELKGGFNARIWQTVALLFDNNLKNNYDPLGDDEAMEVIVQEIESKGHFEMKR